MHVFDHQHIRNIVLVGGAHSGKTTLAETMLFEAGTIPRRGSVESKNTVSDFHAIEHERGNSVFATTMHTEWRNYKINLIDTPGLDDFIGEIVAPLRVADTCLVVINAQHGVEVGTELLWPYVDQYRKPVIFVINQLDHPNADFEMSFGSIRDHFGNNAVLMQYPLNTGFGFNSVIDLLKMVMYVFPEGGGKPEKHEIPENEFQTAEELHRILVEKAAENDEELMNSYFEKGSLDEEEMRKGLHLGMLNHELFPVFCVSALHNMGSGRLMGFIDHVAPAGKELGPEQTDNGEALQYQENGPAVTFIFRTEFEPNLGKISFFKVLSGEIRKGVTLKNSDTHSMETFNQLFVMDGHNRTPVEVLKSGDIGATLKLKNSDTNQTLHALEKEFRIRPIEFPSPRLTVAVRALNKKDEERMGEILRKVHEQDPTIQIEYNSEVRQLLLHCQGELHLATTRWALEHVHHLEVDFEKPKVPYRETIQRAANASYRHKKQSGGAGQFAEVHMRIEPWYEGIPDPTGFPLREKQLIDLAWAGKLEFCNCITGGVIDARFIPSVLKGVMQKMEHGPLTGSHVRDVRVILYDGKMHPVDSNDISFQIAGAMAFREAFINAQPRLLEPVCEVEINAPEEVTGEILTDLQSRRGIILGMDSNGLHTRITARVPMANLYKYSTALRSASQGKGTFVSRVAEYASVPSAVQEEVVSANQPKAEELA